MGIFNVLAAGNNALRGLVRRPMHRVVDDGEMIPEFSMRPGAVERISEARREPRREDPLGAHHQDVMEREISAAKKKTSKPRVRSTFRPEQLPPLTEPKTDPSPPTREEPGQVARGSVWSQKLKMARRGRTIARVKRQPKRPLVYRKAGTIVRRRRSPNWMAAS
ncbi:MAG: hypothetical protein CMO80_09065 [Verrucomicrobiales bacterium]|nr:hypothetical protein [Verrucomicrobiales bacterium]|tara:strand:- start:6823 stop:7314 length:492 start_codon:yes stop_codon:yes gene_type:complete